MKKALKVLTWGAQLAGAARLTPEEILYALRLGFLDAGRLDLAAWIRPERLS